MSRRLILFTFVVAASVSAFAAVRARTFDAALMLDRNGGLFVEETIAFAVPQATFIRTIPLRRPVTGDVFVIRVLGVQDLDGRELRWRGERRDDAFVLHMTGPASGGRIKYLVPNAVRFAPTGDELAWPATDASIAVDVADVRVALPLETKGQFRAQAHLRSSATGAPVALWSSTGALPLVAGEAELETHSPGPLRAGVTVALGVFLNQGILKQPGFSMRAGWYLEENRIVFLPLAILLLMLALRALTRPPADTIVPAYEPPPSLTPAEAGTLIDDRVDPRDIASTLVDLAVRGFVRFDQIEAHNGEPNFKITLLRTSEEQGTLATHERTMLFHTFYGGHWTELSSLRLRLPSLAPLFADEVRSRLRDKGLYRNLPYSPWLVRNVGLALAAVLTIAAQWTGLIAVARNGLLSFSVLAVCAALVFVLGNRISPKTRAGWRTWTQVRGFEDFLNRVDADRMQRLTPDLYERYLAYAMALDVERGWTAAFDDIAIPQPEWFGAEGGLSDPALFGDALHAFLEHTLHQVRSVRAPRFQPKVLAAKVSAE
jgi:Predicted membrane protein (DUF2207)